MTTLKRNFKSQKVPSQYTGYLDIEPLLTKPADKDGQEPENRTTKKPQYRRSRFSRISTYVSPSINWEPIESPYDCLNEYNHDQGIPYVLLPGDDSQSSMNMTRTDRRLPTCHAVYRERRPKLECPDVNGLMRGIRLSICIDHTHFPLIGKISKGMGFTHVPEHRLWNIQWCDNTPHFDLLKGMKRFQQINHFPGMSEICRKDLLSCNLNRMLKMYPIDYRIFPRTWLLPNDTCDVHSYAGKHRRTFILKPYSSGMGRGIWLTNNVRNVRKAEKLICQTYIEKPLLIDGYKFDLRVYTLITSVDPLRIFVYNEGLARFATNKYMPPRSGTSDNLFMHLTNYCVNRRNCNYDPNSGSKRKLSAYNKWLEEHNYNVDEFWATVDDAIIKTVISAWPMLKHNYHTCFPKHDKIQACFQLLGFDILVDWKLKPFILEVNHMPSLAGGEPVDFEVKRPLIRDTLNLISTPLVDKEEIMREDRALQRERIQQMYRCRVKPASNRESSSTQRAAGGAEGPTEACPLSALAQQIAWEESHLGNYRRIMPPSDSDRFNYYLKFYNQYKPVPPNNNNNDNNDNNASQSLHKLNTELEMQEKMQRRLEKESRQLRLGRQRNAFNAINFIAKKQQNFTQLLKQKRLETLAIIKDTHMQGQNQKKDAVSRRKTIDDQPRKVPNDNYPSNKTHESESEAKSNCTTQSPTKRKKRILTTAKAPRHAQKRIKRARNLEQEQFLNANIPATVQDCAEQRTPKSSQKSRGNSPPRTIQPNPQWLPQPKSNELLQDDWRTERVAAIEYGKLKELLFHEMYQRGHLTKNDIKQRPDLLYALLHRQMDQYDHCEEHHFD